ncbi:hypothetical protein ANN_12855, partial [Periplaneta americana]
MNKKRKILYNIPVVFICLDSVIPKLITSKKIDEILETETTKEILEDRNLWYICNYHFSSTEILTVIVDLHNIPIWNDLISNIVQGLQEKLNLTVIMIRRIVIRQDFQSPEEEMELDTTTLTEIRDFPPESLHSYLIISQGEKNAEFHVTQKSYPADELTTKDNYMILIVAHEEWYDCNKEHSYFNVFDELWTEYWILNVLTVVKYINTCDKVLDILVFNPFIEDGYGTINSITVQKLQDFPKTYLERTWNLGKYHIKVCMFEYFPNAILKCENSGECNYDGRDWNVLQNLAKHMNFTPLVREPSDGQQLGYRDEDGNYTGAMRDLIFKRTDISGNQRFLNSLLDAVTSPHVGKDIDNLKQLYESQLPIVTLEQNLLDTFNESQEMERLVPRLIYQNMTTDTLLKQ